MRLPWNRKYLEICFHVIITVLILVGMGTFLLWLPQAKNVIMNTARGFLAVFAPVLWALFFTLLLEPMVELLQRQYTKRCSLRRRVRIRNRKAGTALAYLLVGIVLYFLGSFLAEKIGDTDIQGMTIQISDYIRRMEDILVLLHVKLIEYGILQNVEGMFSIWTKQVATWMELKILGLTGIFPVLWNSLLDILIGGTIAFYFLMEKERMLGICKEIFSVLLGEKNVGKIRTVFGEIYAVCSGYLSGQMLDAVIMAVLFSVVFLIVGLPKAVILGLLSGFSNLIPYFGALVAFILAVFAGILSGTPVKALYAAILILLLQQVDSIFIVPKVVGKKVELHPVLVLLSLAVFGRLFGFWGLFLAVPLGALGKSFLLWLYERKKSEPFQ